MDKNGIYNNITTYKKYNRNGEFRYDVTFYPHLVKFIVALYECLSRENADKNEDSREIYDKATIELTNLQYKKEFMFEYIKDIYNS